MRTECKEWGYGGGQRDAISFFNEDETRSFRLPAATPLAFSTRTKRGRFVSQAITLSCVSIMTQKKDSYTKGICMAVWRKIRNLSRDARARTGDLCNVTAAL